MLDNFGGGTLSGGQGFTNARSSTRNRIAGQEKDPDPYDVELTNAELFWQGITPGSELTTKVTFTQLDRSAKLQKPQSNGLWGEGVIQVLYDVRNARIQLWRFDEKAWVQVGKDISVRFADGDVFRVFALKDGSVEIYQNDKLLTTERSLIVPAPLMKPTPSATPSSDSNAGAPVLSGAEGANFAPMSLKLPAPVSAPYQQSGSLTIDYVYDPLYRLTSADYSNGDSYLYTYDAVGNRLTQQTLLGTTNYTYDNANRLTSVNGVNYSWDNNGNLLNDGVNSYSYNAANQLSMVNGPSSAVTYAYNGFGDRLRQTVSGNTTTFTMDLNPSTSLRAGMGLTQTLSDGTNTYAYGLGRISQTQGLTTEYFLTDAIGSVRQLTNQSGAITYASTYDPFGVTTSTSGASQTSYGFAGEYTSNDLIYLRARFYAPGTGRFLTRDTWTGFDNSSLSQNKYIYGFSNPITFTDSGGNNPCLAALGLTQVDGPVIPFGDIAAVYICARYLIAIGMGLSTATYVANGPEAPFVPRERVIPEIIPLDQILAECWLVIRPKPSPTPDPFRVPFPIKLPQATKTPEPRMLHLAFGNNKYLNAFWEKLFLHYLPQNEDVILYTEWTQEGITTYGSNDDFNLAFLDAVHNPRVKKIHVNLEGIVPKYAATYRSYIDEYSGGGVWQKPRGRSEQFHVFAWELYQFRADSILCKNKVTFYEHGSMSLTPSESAKNEICTNQ